MDVSARRGILEHLENRIGELDIEISVTCEANEYQLLRSVQQALIEMHAALQANPADDSQPLRK